jgi:arabinogalactan endo-1,4-beta-galactosidase
MVQTGNEINQELLGQADWKGRAINWERNAKLLNAAIKAVRDAGAKSTIKPKVMLHIAQPENVEPWFQAAAAAGVTDFDVIGISYYHKWSKETIAELGATIKRLTIAYPKAEVMVVETAYPWTKDWADNTPNQLGGDDSIDPGYPATPAGQAKYLFDLSQTVISLASSIGHRIGYRPSAPRAGAAARRGRTRPSSIFIARMKCFPRSISCASNTRRLRTDIRGHCACPAVASAAVTYSFFSP